MLNEYQGIVIMRRMIAHGAHGVVKKTATISEFKDAFYTVLRGQRWQQNYNSKNNDWYGQRTCILYALRTLTCQETKVLRFVRAGLRNKKIAIELSLTEHTIKTYMSNILRKLNFENRPQLVIVTQKYGDECPKTII